MPAICWSSSVVQAPDPVRLHVEVVDRARQQREHEAERAREDEGDEEVDGLGARREVPRARLEDGPPEQRARGQVGHVLEMEERMVLERRVVGGRDMPDGVGGEPERKGDRRPGQKPNGPEAADLGGQRRWDPQDQEQRDPLGQRDVLHEVGREEVVVGERRERCRQDGHEEGHPRGEAGGLTPSRPVASRRVRVRAYEDGGEGELDPRRRPAPRRVRHDAAKDMAEARSARDRRSRSRAARSSRGRRRLPRPAALPGTPSGGRRPPRATTAARPPRLRPRSARR